MSGTRRRPAAALALCLAACAGSGAQTAASPPVATIPHWSGPWADTARRHSVEGLAYDPVDVVLAWPDPDTLLVAHVEHYAAAVSRGTCEGSGFYVVALSSGTARALGIGSPACESIWGAAPIPGTRVDRGQGTIYTTRLWRYGIEQLARFTFPAGPLDTIATGCPFHVREPDVSPDGKLVAFDGICESADLRQPSLYVVGADGSGLRRLTFDTTIGVADPRWSPDGRRIAWTRIRWTPIPDEDVMVRDVDGDADRVVAYGHSAAWSPDGRQLAYIGQPRGDYGPVTLRVVGADGTGDREIFRNRERTTMSRGWSSFEEGGVHAALVWSPDGKWIAFGREFDAGTSLWRVNVETGELRQVTRPAPGTPVHDARTRTSP